MAETVTNGGDGVYSYSKNSSFQRKGTEDAKELINKAIVEKLEISNFSASNATFNIADLGCSTGPNTFLAVQSIIDAVQLKYQNQAAQSELVQVPEFQVFFNDQALNDFNTLFTSLPPKRQYYAAGVPGSFHCRLFPSGTLHFVFSSYSVQILSRIPKEVLDKNSPAWNKGRIHYSNSISNEVVKSYKNQYVKDMESFLNVRAQEMAVGGLMAFIIPGRPHGASNSDVYVNKGAQLLESCLLDLVDKGVISEEKVDSFNIPTYMASLEEIEELVSQNGCFSIEIMESLPQEMPSAKVVSSTMRGGMGGMIKQHFGEEILDDLFDLVFMKFEEASSTFDPDNAIILFVCLKRVATY